MAQGLYLGRVSSGTRKFTNGFDLAAYMRTVVKTQMKETWKTSLEYIGQTMIDELRETAGTYAPGPPGFKPWAPLANATIERKLRRLERGTGGGKDGDPFTVWWDSGQFAESLNMKVLPGVKQVKINSPEEYTAYMEFGTWHMPPRPLFEKVQKTKVTPKVLPVIETMMAEALDS